MKIEKWNYKSKEIDVLILDKDEIELNEDLDNNDLEKTSILTGLLNNKEGNNDR